MKVLVTGGAGFIGSHVVDSVADHGHEPRILDMRPSPYRDDVETTLGDMRDPDVALAAVRGCDAVIHLAAVADVNDVLKNPTLADEVNVRGTQSLLEAARSEGISRFVYASTVWVYGNTPAQGVVDEESPLSLPAHLYTATKLAGEMYCRSYQEMYGLSHTILRFGIPYGPRSRAAAVVAAFVARAEAGEALTIAGDGGQTRQFVYVRDLADGVVASLVPEAAGRVYNLVRDESVSIRRIADTVRELVADVPLLHGPERPVDVTIPHVSGERAAAELGWEATTGFEDGVRLYLDSLSETNGSPSSAAA